MTKKYILTLCDFSGIMAKPWREAGYEEIRVDLEHEDGVEDGVWKRVYDVRDLEVDTIMLSDKEKNTLRERVKMIFAFPPCTHIAVSGARWFRKKGLRALSEAIDTFGACVNIIEELGIPGFVENPVSVISSHYRKPDYTFDPCDYGDPYTKKTCLWTFNGFIMPPKNRVEPEKKSKIHYMPPSEERGRLRSLTPEGFARAVYEANK